MVPFWHLVNSGLWGAPSPMWNTTHVPSGARCIVGLCAKGGNSVLLPEAREKGPSGDAESAREI